MVTSTPTVKVLATWPANKLANITLGAVAYFALTVLALHFLRPDLNPISQPASAYAIGPFGVLMSTAFFSLSLGSWALVLAIARGVPSVARSRAGLVLLGLWAISVLLAMIFPMDVESAPPTLSGVIHQASGFVGFFCLTAGVFLVSRRLTAAAGWRHVKQALLLLATLMLGEYAVMAVAFATGSPLAGLGQRIYLAILITWLLLTAGQLRANADDAQ